MIGMIIATGDASPSPHIHVWGLANLEPFKIIRSFHSNGVLNMAFSKEGSFLVSLGMDKYFRQLTQTRPRLNFYIASKLQIGKARK